MNVKILVGERARQYGRALEIAETHLQMGEQQVAEVLAGCQGMPLWSAVLSVLEAHARAEMENAVRPNLEEPVRAYNSGRAAMLVDFQLALLQVQAKAEQLIRGKVGDK